MIIKEEDIKIIKGDDIVFCSGWFDLFHVGHLRFLNEAKKCGKTLVVLLKNDKDGKSLKGEFRPFIKQCDRAEILDNLKCVDYVILNENHINKNSLPKYFKVNMKNVNMWNRNIPIIEELKPSVIFAIKETYENNGFEKWFIDNNYNLIYNERIDNISTSLIANKIKEGERVK